MPGAGIAAEHKRRGSIVPTFKYVRAARFLTDGVEVQALNQLQDVILVRRVADAHTQPVWLRQTLALRGLIT